MTPSEIQARDEAAEKSSHRELTEREFTEAYAKQGAWDKIRVLMQQEFKAGANWMRSYYMEKGGEEFDEVVTANKHMGTELPAEKIQQLLSGSYALANAVELARWQHSKDAVQISALKSENEELKLENETFIKKNDFMGLLNAQFVRKDVASSKLAAKDLELERLTKGLQYFNEALATVEKQCEEFLQSRNRIKEQNQKLRSALEFYADSKKWHEFYLQGSCGNSVDGDLCMMFDDGEDSPWSIAKKALAKDGGR